MKKDKESKTSDDGPRIYRDRTLPILKKGDKIKHKLLGVGEVLQDEEIGCCLARFSGKSKGVRSIQMCLAHYNIKIIEPEV